MLSKTSRLGSPFKHPNSCMEPTNKQKITKDKESRWSIEEAWRKTPNRSQCVLERSAPRILRHIDSLRSLERPAAELTAAGLAAVAASATAGALVAVKLAAAEGSLGVEASAVAAEVYAVELTVASDSSVAVEAFAGALVASAKACVAVAAEVFAVVGMPAASAEASAVAVGLHVVLAEASADAVDVQPAEENVEAARVAGTGLLVVHAAGYAAARLPAQMELESPESLAT